MEKNEFKIITTQIVDDCQKCPDFSRQVIADPYDLYDDTPDIIKCKQSGAKLNPADLKAFKKKFPIPDTCPRLKKCEEKEREL